MNLQEGQIKFIETWGKLGCEWGINRTMASIHALLLITPNELCAEEIMDKLQISRGNANMNLRDLIGWGLVEKILKPGDRKEYFFADKDIWNIAKQVAKERRKRELDPVTKALNELNTIEGDKNDPEYATFMNSINDIQKFTSNMSKTLDTMFKAEENWFWGSLFKIFK